MKRIVLALILSIFMGVNFAEPANAGFFADKKAKIQKNVELRKNKKSIKNFMAKQNDIANMHNIDWLAKLYSEDFICSDGFKKDVYFKLIDETWDSYKDISYTTEVKNIRVDNDKAEVDVYETAIATLTQVEEGIAISGELNSYSNGTYYLKKNGKDWIITGEKIKDEKSFLKYGDTRFVDMDLKSPKTAKAGEYYTASLEINAPENSFFVASISKDEITHPQKKSEEVYRTMPDDGILERMFIANKNGRNEYNVAAVGMSRSKVYEMNKVGVYMAGIAFIMARVNVEEENAQNQ